jgi:DNA-binding NarL/FixJ family response regulator
MKKILIVDDHEEFRAGVKNFLKQQKMDLAISESDSAEEAIAKAAFLRPDVILMDIRLPNMNGIDASGKIKAQLPNCKIIILTVFETEVFRDVFKSDAIVDYIGKSELYEKLVPALNKVFHQNGHSHNNHNK